MVKDGATSTTLVDGRESEGRRDIGDGSTAGVQPSGLFGRPRLGHASDKDVSSLPHPPPRSARPLRHRSSPVHHLDLPPFLALSFP